MNVAAKISELLGVEDAIGWSGKELDAALAYLPIFLRSEYELSGVELLGQRMIAARPNTNVMPSALINHMELIAESTGLPPICALDTSTPYQRRTLVAGRVAFVTGDGQAFVPGLLRLSPTLAAKPPIKRGIMSPSARSAFVYLATHAHEDVTAANLIRVANMSRASANRALEEIRASLPLSREISGPKMRTAVYRVGNPESFVYEGSRSFGPSIKERFYLPENEADGLPLSGLSALAKRSLLSSPQTPEVACGPRDAARLKKLATENPDGSVEIQVLTYDPMPFVDDGMVDLCTMAMVVDREDERVSSCLAEAVEKEAPWLTSLQ